MIRHYPKLLRASSEREVLREKGQFWTPHWVAEAMVAYVVRSGSNHIFDPAVGAGAFFLAAKTLSKMLSRKLVLLGTELDPRVLSEAQQGGLSEEDLANVRIADFLLAPLQGPFKAIVANPPYIRHHRIPDSTKAQLKAFATKLIGTPLDGRAGIHIYFLLRALQLLDKDGRLAFIMPSDTCEGVFAKTLWNWITKNYRLEAVITFTPEATPFPKLDINPLIFLIRNVEPVEDFLWATCHKAGSDELKCWILSGFENRAWNDLSVYRRTLSEALDTGLSRPPVQSLGTTRVLGDFAKVLRGVATGANDFFFLTRQKADALGIPDEFLIPAIGRTRDVSGNEITNETLRELEAKGRPTLLFAPDGRPFNEFPKPVREYLKNGEELGIHKRPLIATRHPWYKMEVRRVPPILFAYLGRRNSRFIRNYAGVVPLTGFLCVYPHKEDPAFIDSLWQVLQQPAVIANLRLIGKSYGAGAIKVEPRALERLPLPPSEAEKLEIYKTIKSDLLLSKMSGSGL